MNYTTEDLIKDRVKLMSIFENLDKFIESESERTKLSKTEIQALIKEILQ